jgi:hypothetical protein
VLAPAVKVNMPPRIESSIMVDVPVESVAVSGGPPKKSANGL